MRMSDWSSDVCSSDLLYLEPLVDQHTRCASGTRGIRRRHENVRDFGLPKAVDKLRHAKPLGELGPQARRQRRRIDTADTMRAAVGAGQLGKDECPTSAQTDGYGRSDSALEGKERCSACIAKG